MAVSPEDPELGTEASDDAVSAAIDDLEQQASKATRIVSAEELEHARLLLELARVAREIEIAKVVGQGVLGLSWQRDQIRQALSDVTARISLQSEGQ